MSRANPLWGAPRIHGELQKLGIEISQATVSKYVDRPNRPPSQTWRTFVDNHVRSLVSVDFFTVPTVTFKVLFVFVVLAHHRRRVVHCDVPLRRHHGRSQQRQVPISAPSSRAFEQAGGPAQFTLDAGEIREPQTCDDEAVPVDR